MSPKRARSRKPARIANSRWIAYGTAGAATALAATVAEAEIHYSGIINVLVSFGERTFPLSNGAVLWFRHWQTTTSYNWGYFELRNAAVSNGWRSNAPYNVPENLARNRPVANGPFAGGFATLFSRAAFGVCRDEFCEQGPAIVGFKFNTGGGPQYGWARLRMKGRTPPSDFYVVEYAWADVGERIRTGQTDSRSQEQGSQEQGAVSPSGSLGHLALGKAGLDLWRAQRLSSVTGR